MQTVIMTMPPPPCTTPSSLTNGGFAPNTGPLTEDACPYECNVGYVKGKGGIAGCTVPADGHYADAQGAEQACEPIANSEALGGSEQVGVPVEGPRACPFSCGANLAKNTDQLDL